MAVAADRRGKLRRDLILATAAALVTRFGGALGGVVVARLLGPEGKGVQALLVLGGTVVGLILTAGLDYWVQREVARPRGDSAQVVAVVRRHQLYTLLTCVGGFALAVAVGAAPAGAAAVALFGFAWVTSTLRHGVVVGQRRLLKAGLASIAQVLAYVVSATVLLVADVPSAAAVVAVGGVSALVLATASGSAAANLSVATVPAPDQYRRAVRFGAPNAMGELVTLALGRIDLVLIALLLLSERSVGLYSVSLAMTELLWVVPIAVAQVLLPKVAGDQSTYATAVLHRVTVWLLLGSGLVMALIARPFISVVFGDEFTDAAVAVAPLALASALLGSWRILIADLVARNRTRVRLESAVVGVVILIVSDLVLIPALGIFGAGIGSALGYAGASVWCSRSWSRQTGEPVASLWRWPGADVTEAWRARRVRSPREGELR